MRRPTFELILAGVMLLLIVAFVVMYGWMLVQIQTVGVNETGETSASVSTEEGSSDTAAATAPSTPGVPPSPAPGAAPGGGASRGGDDDLGAGGGLRSRAARSAGLGGE